LESRDGAIVDVLYREHPPYAPALLFDKIKDHAKGFRALFGHFASPRRIALTLGVTEEFDHILEFTRMYHEKIKHCAPVPMIEVKSGPVHKNVQEGERVNLFDFPPPAPRKGRRPLYRYGTFGHHQGSRFRLGQCRHLSTHVTG